MVKPASFSQREADGAADIGARQIGVVFAKAFLGAAENAGTTEALLAELDSFLDDVLDELPALESVLASGLVAADVKVSLLDRTLASQASPLLLAFLKVLAEHGRLDALRAVRRAAHELYDQLRGRVAVHVATAAPLNDTQAARIVEQTRGILGGQPHLVRLTDPDLIGGLVLRVGDTVFDGSVAGRLVRLRAQMIARSVDEIQRRRDRFRHPAGN